MKKAVLVLAGVAIVLVATAGAANAQIGVAAKWAGGGIAPYMALPIMVGDDMVIEPCLYFYNESDYGSQISFGGSIEKQMREGTSPLFGGQVMVDLFSPDEGDSYTNFGFGVFLGGTVEMGDNFEMVGQWGPSVWILDENAGDATIISTEARVTFRWWVFGN